VVKAIDLIRRMLKGEKVDLSAVALDLVDTTNFEDAVYAATRSIPCGEVRTYGDIARAIGEPHATQAVGAALGRNPVPIVIPCHRVLGAAGKAGGFSAPGGTATKFRMLEIEGARRPGEPELFEQLPLAVKPGG
jgi:methylated-DNA-[protein]-cysteine S-methyltransferase